MCDSVALIKEGHLVASGSLADVKKKFTEPSIMVRFPDRQNTEKARAIT